jgi:hypothetical protein
MSKDKKIDSEFETKKSDYSPLVRDTLIMSALELGYRMLYSFYKRYNDDRSSVRLYRSMKNLNSSSLSQLNSEFFKSKQHTTFLHRYPERMQYILSLSQEERSVFMADAIKDKNPHEILLRDTFEDNKLLNSGEHHVLEYILKDKLTGPWNVDPRSHKIMKDLGGGY